MASKNTNEMVLIASAVSGKTSEQFMEDVRSILFFNNGKCRDTKKRVFTEDVLDAIEKR